MATINKEGIVRRFNDKMGEGLAKSHTIIEKVFETIADILKEGHAVRIQGFGGFKLKHVPERKVNIPLKKEGADTVVPAHTSVQFKISTGFKESLKDVKISTY